MNDAFEPWFSAKFDKARRAKLAGIGSYEEVISRVKASIQSVEARSFPGTDLGLTQCWRPEFTVYVDADSFDAFFNAQCGYRAQFARDPDLGLAANGQLIRAISGQLLSSAGGKAGLTQLQVRL